MRESLRPGCDLMVVGDLDVVGITCLPAKANAVLLVDADAVLAQPVAMQLFEMIPRGYGEFR